MGRRGNIFLYNSPTTNTRFVPLFPEKRQNPDEINLLEAGNRRDAGMKVNLGKGRKWKPQRDSGGRDALQPEPV